MRKSANLLVVVCFLVMLALISLQGYWIRKYYTSTLKDFEKEVNLAFEDGIKKELSLRCDTIQAVIEKKLLDTNAFSITARFDEKGKKYIYSISSTDDRKDKFSSSFSLVDYNKALSKTKNDTSVRRHVAGALALLMREQDLETHTIYYRTQKLGAFMNEQAQKYQFDTVRLRPSFNLYLKERDIDMPYYFVVKKIDSTINQINPKTLSQGKRPIITKAFPTYRYTDNQRYVRAVFANPISYVLAKMNLMLFSSITMIIIVCGCIIFILKSLFKEKKLSKIKSDFISNITHEFKTPIAIVSVSLEALANSEIRQDHEKRTRYLKHAKDEIYRLNNLVDKVLHISMYEGGKNIILKENVCFDGKILELINLSKIATEKKVSIVYYNKSDVNSIVADPTQFEHAISNIIENAMKYSRDEIKLIITATRKDNYLEIEFEDNGLGIAEKDLAAVFDKFYRVSTGNSHLVKGYGLGLNYVKQIMAQNHGFCKIESKLNVGTKLTLGWLI